MAQVAMGVAILAFGAGVLVGVSIPKSTSTVSDNMQFARELAMAKAALGVSAEYERARCRHD